MYVDQSNGRATVLKNVCWEILIDRKCGEINVPTRMCLRTVCQCVARGDRLQLVMACSRCGYTCCNWSINIIVCEKEVQHGQPQAVELVISVYLERGRKHSAGGR